MPLDPNLKAFYFTGVVPDGTKPVFFLSLICIARRAWKTAPGQSGADAWFSPSCFPSGRRQCTSRSG